MKNPKHIDPLPPEMRKRAIQFAREATGIQRPCKENAPLVKAWEDGFLAHKELIQNSLRRTR